MTHPLRLLFLAHPRSGSSSLYEVLQSHPDLNILEEPFNENFTRWNPAKKNYLELVRDIPSLDEQVAEIFDSHNGIKILDYQLPADFIARLLRRADCNIVFLRRRNLLQAVVSVLIAEQTKLWKKWEMTKPLEEYYKNLQPLDIAEVCQRVSEIKCRLDFFESVVDDRSNSDALKLMYEELYFCEASRQREQFAAIWKLLGVAPLDLKGHARVLQPEAARINSTETYTFLPNAREIDIACGSDITGWLYESHPIN